MLEDAGRRRADRRRALLAALPEPRRGGVPAAAARSAEVTARRQELAPVRRDGPATSPTSSTPPAPPAAPRGWPSSTGAPWPCCAGRRRASRARGAGGVLAATSICFDLSVFELFVPLARGGTRRPGGERAGAAGARRRPRRGDPGQHRPLGAWPSCCAARGSAGRRCARSTWRASRCRGRWPTQVYGAGRVERRAQPLRPDRGHHLLDRAPCIAAGERGDAADRPADRRHPGLPAGRRRWSRCPPGCPGELLPGRRRPGARLPGPAGADRGALRARSRSPASRARGSTAPATWRAGCPDGELEFLGRSTTRSRSAASASSWARSRRRCASQPGGARGRGRGCGGRAGRPPAGGLRGPGAGRAPPGARAARLPAASGCRRTWCRRPSCRLDALPLTPNGKVDRARPAGAASGATVRAGGVRGAAHARRGGPGRDLGARCWALDAGGRPRQLLRAGRALAAGDPGGLPGAPASSASSCRCARSSRRRPSPRSRRGRGGAGAPAPAARGAAARAGARERAAAAVLRPAAPLVPRPARAGRALPTTSPAGGAPRGARSIARRSRRSLARDRAPARGAAHHLPRAATASRSRQVDPAAAAPPLDAGSSTSAGCRRRRAQARGAAPGGRGGAAARSTSRAARCCAPACCAWREREHAAAADAAPHRHRRLVDGRAGRASWRRSTRPSLPGRPSPLPELPVQYADFAVWQRRWLAGEGAGAAARLLAGAAGRRAGAAGAAHRPAAARGAGPARRRAAVPPRHGSSPRRSGRWAAAAGGDACSWRCSPPSRLLLARYTGQDDVVRRHADRRPPPAWRPRG